MPRDFEKKRGFLVCVDSDGCVMDTMNSKHTLCFGPCLVEEWGLEKWRGEILEQWNEMNLFLRSRGINRFKGLALALKEIDRKYTPIAGVEELCCWVKESGELSDFALETAIRTAPQGEKRSCLEKALNWSREVNRRIKKLPPQMRRPFDGADKALQEAHTFADVAVVSSANRTAVEEEWVAHRLCSHVDFVMAQDCGSKARCIKTMLKKGYAPDHLLMVGDAPGDWEAARANGVLFYPILVNREEESWKELRTAGFAQMREGTFAGEYQDRKLEEFWENLGG